MRPVSCILFAALVLSCSSKNDESLAVGLRKSSTALLLSDYFSSATAHSLQSEQPIGAIDKLLVTDSGIFVSDFYLMKSLRAFDQNGLTLAYRDDIGEGPMGLGEITDFEVYRDTIYVLDAHKRKLLRFTKNLETLDELDVPVPCSNFTINDAGIFLFRQGKEATEGRVVQLSHQMDLIKSLLPSDEFNTELVVSNTGFFTQINSTDFAVSNPFYPYLWVYRGNEMEKIELDFNGQFIDAEEMENMGPLDRLGFVNSFEGFYNLAHGIKLNNSEFLFSIRYRKKNGYLKINLDRMEMAYHQSIKNDLMKIPSTITFAGNSGKGAWYWMNEEDLGKFYRLNASKIPEKDRIPLTGDPESKFVFRLAYQ